jgi:hypothetical protein
VTDISTRRIAGAGVLVVYAAFALRQLEPVTVLYFVAAAVAALLLTLSSWTSSWMGAIRIAATALAYGLFVAGRIETRRIAMATMVAVWVIASTYFARRLTKMGREVVASVFGTIADLWLIAMLTLLSLEGYIVTGLLLIAAASWLPRAGRARAGLTAAFALIGGWLIIAAEVDFDLELRRWYLLGALAVGIGASLLASAQEVQQGKDVHPQ